MLYELLLSFSSDYPTWPRFWDSGSLVESKWSHYVMVEADSHLKLLSTPISDIYKVFEWIDMLSMGTVSALHSYTHTTWLRFSGSGSLVGNQNDVIMSRLRLTVTSNCFMHTYWTYTKSLSTLICCPLACSSSLTQFTHPTWLRFWGSGSLVESTWCDYVMVEADSHLKLLLTSILDMYKVFGHIDVLSIGIW